MNMLRQNQLIALFAALVAIANVAMPARGSGDLLARMTALNPHLDSYQATVRADIVMHSFPFLAPSLDGTFYHKEPSEDKLVFTGGLPGIAQEFSKIYPHIDSPSQWDRVYVVSIVGDDGTSTTFRLVPRKHGRVDHLDAVVDDKTATITSMRWNYNDSGYAEMQQTYTKVDGYYLVDKQTGHFERPGYNGDATWTFTNFKLNPPLTDAFFNQT
jgi:hypothetical protein